MIGHDACHFKILIRSGIPDVQTKMSVSEKGSNGIKILGSKPTLLFSPMFAHYIGFSASCKRVTIAGLLINFSDEG